MAWLGNKLFFLPFRGRAKRSLLSLCSFSSISNKLSPSFTDITNYASIFETFDKTSVYQTNGIFYLKRLN
jgi:hypothetical protein